MESTGVYWKPVINILEPAGFTLLVVNAQHIKYVPGHKTDKKDSAWICKLLRAGLLKGSFIPDRAQRDLRDLTRYRRKKVQEVTAEKNRMLKVFEDANLKLSSVFSNVNGVTCTRIIDEILKGNTDPDYLASLCTHGKLKSSKEQIRDAVEGVFTEHHKFMLKAIRRSIASLEEEIAELEAEIDRRCEPVQEEIERLCTIPGIDKTGAKELIAEIGVNMEVFPTAANLASWSGVSPGNNESAGKKKLAREPREQGDQGNHHGMRLGREPHQEHVHKRKIRKTGSTSGQEKGPRSHSTRATYYCVPCLEGSGRLLRTWMRIC